MPSETIRKPAPRCFTSDAVALRGLSAESGHSLWGRPPFGPPHRAPDSPPPPLLNWEETAVLAVLRWQGFSLFCRPGVAPAGLSRRSWDTQSRFSSRGSRHAVSARNEIDLEGNAVRTPAQRHSRAKHKTRCQLYLAACQAVASPAARSWPLRTETGSGMSL